MEFDLLIPSHMPMRDFRDSMGIHWVVWSTIPWTASVLDAFRGGWLTFVSCLGRRRLQPIPIGWEDASPRDLETWCRAANDAGVTIPQG